MWHEIVNDTVGGVPVAVTYCPLCNSVLPDFKIIGLTRMPSCPQSHQQTGESPVGLSQPPTCNCRELPFQGRADGASDCQKPDQGAVRLLVYRMLEAITELKQSGFEECRKVGRTLENWQGGDRADVAVLTIERHHRRLPPKDEADPAPCLRLPQFRKLPSTRAGTMRLTKNTMKDEEEV